MHIWTPNGENFHYGDQNATDVAIKPTTWYEDFDGTAAVHNLRGNAFIKVGKGSLSL